MDIREIEASATNAVYPLCYSGVWFCSKVGSSDTTGILGDGSTQGSCASGSTCFSGPVVSTDSNGCRGINHFYTQNARETKIFINLKKNEMFKKYYLSGLTICII